MIIDQTMIMYDVFVNKDIWTTKQVFQILRGG